MTYNFDPDKWYDDELYMIQTKLKKSEITQEKYDLAVLALDQKIEAMWKHLDIGHWLMSLEVPGFLKFFLVSIDTISAHFRSAQCIVNIVKIDQ